MAMPGRASFEPDGPGVQPGAGVGMSDAEKVRAARLLRFERMQAGPRAPLAEEEDDDLQ